MDTSIWSRNKGSGYTVVYHTGKENVAADALSRNPLRNVPAEGLAESEAQIAAISSWSRATIQEVLQFDPVNEGSPHDLLEAQ